MAKPKTSLRGKVLQLVLVAGLLTSSLSLYQDPNYPSVLPSAPEARAETSPALGQPTAPAPELAPTPVLLPKPATAAPTPESHPNYPYYALANPNDPNYTTQWHLGKISAPQAWDISSGSGNQIIAVIDTGFSLNHPDLASQWATNAGETGPTSQQGPAPNCTSRGLALDKSCNNIDDDADGYTDNWRGWDFVSHDNDPQTGTTNSGGSGTFHGTFVAGLAAGTGNNGLAGTGVSWNSKIMPLQVLDDNGSGYTNDVAAAVKYAADHGAKVINMSLGSSYQDLYLQSQIDYAISRGVIVVAAAGNNGCNCLSYPANFPEVVAVGATDQSDAVAGYSSYGTNLDLVAPGSNLCSTYWSAGSPNGFACGGSGTSFASPLVAGAISLLLDRSGVNAATAERYLKSSSDVVSAMNGARPATQYGYGRLNVYQLLLAATLPAPIFALSDKPATTVALSDSQNVSSQCHSRITTCWLRFSGPNNVSFTLTAQNVNQWGDATVDWNATNLGLTAGQWQIDSLDASGISSPPAFITVTP